MKKTFLTFVAAAAMLFSAQTASAQVYEEAETGVEAQAQQESEFQSIQAQDLPDAVSQAVERDYAGAAVSEAYVKEKDGMQKYKIVIATKDGQTQELFADAEGNWIEK